MTIPSCEESNEAYILGPPGTGKTTYVTRQVTAAVNKYGGGAVLVTSYTTAAAAELASRNTAIDRQQLGTLHSICYRALGCPPIAETKIADWNRAYPQFRLSRNIHGRNLTNLAQTGSETTEEGEKGTENDDDIDSPPDEFSQSETLGDELYSQSHILRAQMVPRENWPLYVRGFNDAWTKWKSEKRLVDFTDLLETALRELTIAPGKPKVIVVDESQDLSRLQIAVLRQWAQLANHILWAADDDQCILRHTGASPEVLFEKSGAEHFRVVLSQSHRVPRRIHALAELWIRQLSQRQPKEYRPRPEEGEVRMCYNGNYRTPEAILDDAERYLARGKKVMFLATCSYLLDPLIRVLCQRGMPYHNPFRRKNPGWNPLARRKRAVHPVDRILGYLTPRLEVAGQPRRPSDLRDWLRWVPSELLTDAGKAFLRRPKKNYLPQPADLLTADTLASLDAAMQADWSECLDWFVDHLQPKRQRSGRYLAEIARRHGKLGLIEEPQIIVGTIHSVKGGEADVVFLFPDLSAAGMKQWAGSPQDRDDVIRVCYVGITRARESLIICEPAKANYISLDSCLAQL